MVLFYFLGDCFTQHFASAMRKLRRAGKIGEFVSIFVNEKQVNLDAILLFTSFDMFCYA